MSKASAAWGLTVLAVPLLALAAPNPDPIPNDETLRKEAMKLNDLYGEEQIEEVVSRWKKKPDAARALLKAALPLTKEMEPPLNHTAGLVLGELAREMRDREAGAAFYNLAVKKAEALKSDFKWATAVSGLIDLYSVTKKYAESEKLCQDLIDRKIGASPRPIREEEAEFVRYRIAAVRRLVQVLALQGKLDEAEQKLEIYAKRAAGSIFILETQAWLLRYTGKYDDAIKVYDKLLDAVSENEAAKDIVRYQLSGLYSDMGDVDKAAEHLQALLKKNPNNASYNNDLGFIWADHDKNLEEAEGLVRKALEREPNNPAYLDSLGWVLFKQKKYEEAKKLLLDALKDPDGQHAEIYDHLADIHMALKEKKAAIEMWKKAIEESGTSKRDQKRKAEIEKKLKEAEAE